VKALVLLHFMRKKNKGDQLRKTEQIISRKTIRIEWGDCDPAQIVHYPRYLSYFDSCTTALFRKAGLSKRQMIEKYQIIGIPLVNLQASFRVPSRLSDIVTVESQVTEWRRSSFGIRHRLFNKGVLAVECSEVRVWAGLSPTEPDKIEGRLVPREVIEKFSAVKKRSRRGHAAPPKRQKR
jgi:4-hydroxybenzoyl-CoA thioesterase